MAFARAVAWLVAAFLLGIGLILLVRPTLATGPHGLPLLKGEPRPMMAVLAAREIVLGLIAAGLVVNDLVGLALLVSVFMLWHDLGGL
jgi:hypothetical protein